MTILLLIPALSWGAPGDITPASRAFTGYSSEGGKIKATAFNDTLKLVGVTTDPATKTITVSASSVGAVPTSRTVAGHALTSDVTITASDVGALASGGTAANSSALGGTAAATVVSGAAAGGTAVQPSGLDATAIGWTATSFVNSWANVGFGYATGGYMKDALSVVHLKGRITGGANGSAAFTLPAGYRPSQILFLIAYGNNGAIDSPVLVTINTSGTVVPAIFAAGASTDISLTGLSFVPN
jgi:hypothetical protein